MKAPPCPFNETVGKIKMLNMEVRTAEGELRTRGLRLQRNGGRVQLTTAPEFAAEVEKYLGLEATVIYAGQPWKHYRSSRSNNR